jgi:telomerase reverse transcriptase
MANSIDVLNRFCDISNDEQSTHIMKHVFPRQFGLHNVFTSSVDPRETTHPFQNYTMRDKEIAAAVRLKKNSKIPKRLRGLAFDLIRKIRKNHTNLSYTELLRHYCPFDVSCPP